MFSFVSVTALGLLRCICISHDNLFVSVLLHIFYTKCDVIII